MSTRRCKFLLSAVLVVLALATVCPFSLWAGTGFQPVNPDELKMTGDPKAPGAPAIILYRQVDRDDNGRTSHEDNYYRVKILTEEGRKYADIEIVFVKNRNNVIGIHARTIKPDGSIRDFDGKVFEKTIEKNRGAKYLAKTFTLPEVQPGSIIEYYYSYDLQENALFDSNWILSDELFTKSAKFSLKPYSHGYPNNFNLRWTWHALPQGTVMPAEGPDHIVRMEAHDIPAFQREDFMPPENEVKSRVDFIYSLDLPESDTNRFWKQVGKKRNGALEGFVGKRKAMEEAVGQIVSANDAPEVKLRKIYDRVQQIRNTSYELRKTEQEEKARQGETGDECRGSMEAGLRRWRAAHMVISRAGSRCRIRGLWLLGFRSQAVFLQSCDDATRKAGCQRSSGQTEWQGSLFRSGG